MRPANSVRWTSWINSARSSRQGFSFVPFGDRDLDPVAAAKFCRLRPGLQTMRSWFGGGILRVYTFADSVFRNKGERDGGYDAQECHQMIPANFFAEIKKGERAEDSEGDDFLDDF